MAHAVEAKFRELLEGSKQYQVPLYQRTYSWKKRNNSRIWDDIVRLAEDRERHGTSVTHFLGSLVLAPTPEVGPVGVSRYLVVDGQQRLTTLTLLLAALRDHRVETEGPGHRDRLNEQYLVNAWRQGDERLKLMPTQADRVSYRACIESTPRSGQSDNVGEAYRYFRGRLAEHDDLDDTYNAESLEEAILAGLTFVTITTSQDDNVHRIFESLNNTGLTLTQGDLLRNYLFMRLPTRGHVVYETQWFPLQQRLGDQLELLFWLDAVQSDDSVTQRDTYHSQVVRMDRLPGESEIESEVMRFNRLGELLERILTPELETDVFVRERLTRLNAWGTTTVYPLLLHLLERRAQGGASSEEIAMAMLYTESFIVRRVLTGRATTNLNRILLRAVPEIRDKSPVDDALRHYLSTGRKFYASDQQVRTRVREVSFYYSGRAAQRKLLLSWIEETFENKEPVDPKLCTVEHIMPQTLTPSWRSMLRGELRSDEHLVDVYDALVHTLGNLTLTGYNSALGNKPFSSKRRAYSKSGFRMNQWIAKQEAWSRSQILERAEDLTKRIIAQWPGPEPGMAQEPMRESWGLMNRALAGLPPGTWTSYSEVARLIGSHQVPVGQRVANHPVPNGHRVLRSDGTASSGFRWLLEQQRSDSQLEALEAEGVVFDADGVANPNQRVDAHELAELAGVEVVDRELITNDSNEEVGRESFVSQLAAASDANTVHGVIETLEAWRSLGGTLEFGKAAETSCFLVLVDDDFAIWPAILYPSGKFEVVFQYLKDRYPFGEVELRDKFRELLNTVPGVELAESKLALRPGFELGLLADEDNRDRVVDALQWFIERVREAHMKTGRSEIIVR